MGLIYIFMFSLGHFIFSSRQCHVFLIANVLYLASMPWSDEVCIPVFAFWQYLRMSFHRKFVQQFTADFEQWSLCLWLLLPLWSWGHPKGSTFCGIKEKESNELRTWLSSILEFCGSQDWPWSRIPKFLRPFCSWGFSEPKLPWPSCDTSWYWGRDPTHPSDRCLYCVYWPGDRYVRMCLVLAMHPVLGS